MPAWCCARDTCAALDRANSSARLSSTLGQPGPGTAQGQCRSHTQPPARLAGRRAAADCCGRETAADSAGCAQTTPPPGARRRPRRAHRRPAAQPLRRGRAAPRLADRPGRVQDPLLVRHRRCDGRPGGPASRPAPARGSLPLARLEFISVCDQGTAPGRSSLPAPLLLSAGGRLD